MTTDDREVQTQPTGTQTNSPTAARPGVSYLVKGGIAFAVVLIIAVSGFVWRSTRKAAPTSAGVLSTTDVSAPVAKMPAPAEATFRFDTAKLNGGGKITGREVKQGRYFSEDLGGGASIDMVAIPAGKFLMGAPETEQQAYPDEGPQHEVTLKRFYMSKFEVTQADWRAIAALPKVTRDLNPDPSKFKGDDLPVENISWEEAVEFCARLSKKSGQVYHLPSESQWEYAARAGSATAFAFGETVTAELANYDGTGTYGLGPIGASRKSTVPVGSLGAANDFGLYDVHGNVREWCAGEYHANYQGAPADGSPWMTGGDIKHRVTRGGGWDNFAVDCRSANRLSYSQDGRRSNIGFRVAMSLQ